MAGNKGGSNEWRKIQEKARQVLGDDFWNDMGQIMPKRGQQTDIYKTEDEIVVVMELPGVRSAAQIGIRLKGYRLTVSGEIPWGYPVEKRSLLQSERYIGDFRKEITLPEDAAPNGLTGAQFKNGLLEIHIKRLREEDEKEVHVKFETDEADAR